MEFGSNGLLLYLSNHQTIGETNLTILLTLLNNSPSLAPLSTYWRSFGRSFPDLQSCFGSIEYSVEPDSQKVVNIFGKLYELSKDVPTSYLIKVIEDIEKVRIAVISIVFSATNNIMQSLITKTNNKEKCETSLS